jgi:hypothetical protein
MIFSNLVVGFTWGHVEKKSVSVVPLARVSDRWRRDSGQDCSTEWHDLKMYFCTVGTTDHELHHPWFFLPANNRLLLIL